MPASTKPKFLCRSCDLHPSSSAHDPAFAALFVEVLAGDRFEDDCDTLATVHDDRQLEFRFARDAQARASGAAR